MVQSANLKIQGENALAVTKLLHDMTESAVSAGATEVQELWVTWNECAALWEGKAHLVSEDSR